MSVFSNFYLHVLRLLLKLLLIDSKHKMRFGYYYFLLSFMFYNSTIKPIEAPTIKRKLKIATMFFIIFPKAKHLCDIA